MILIWLDGGPPQHETYDPKPDAPAEFRGPLKAISTSMPGVQVSELLPRQAQLLDKVSIIRSLHHDNGDHYAAAHWMLTGYLGSNAINMAPQYPSVGSIVARMKGAKQAGDAGVRRPAADAVRSGSRRAITGRPISGSAYNPFNADGNPGLREVPGSEPLATRRASMGPGSRGGGGLMGVFEQARRAFDDELGRREPGPLRAGGVLAGARASRRGGPST